jgi:hypothetical protein
MDRSKLRASTGQLAALLLLSIEALCVSGASAQRIAAAGSGQVQAVRQNVGTGAITRVPGGERVGTSSFAVSEGKARVVGGKVAGYGTRVVAGGLGEYISGGPTGSKGSNPGGNRDFPETDFVATMPRISVPAVASTGTSLLGSNFGLTLSPGNVGGPKSDLTASHAREHKVQQPKTRDSDAILHPFTHPIGVGNAMATGLGSSH